MFPAPKSCQVAQCMCLLLRWQVRHQDTCNAQQSRYYLSRESMWMLRKQLRYHIDLLWHRSYLDRSAVSRKWPDSQKSVQTTVNRLAQAEQSPSVCVQGTERSPPSARDIDAARMVVRMVVALISLQVDISITGGSLSNAVTVNATLHCFQLHLSPWHAVVGPPSGKLVVLGSSHIYPHYHVP